MVPRYNLAPTQFVATIKQALDVPPAIAMARWGLIPSWAKDASIGNKLINARGETAATKPSFRSAFRHRRCLILADGFYEWRVEGGSKQPYYISMKDGQPFALAGLWERWDDGQSELPLTTCTIITTEPNEMMSRLHRRMPVILPAAQYARWLDPANEDVANIQQLLLPFDSDAMTARPVSLMVNNPRNDGPQVLDAVPPTDLFEK